MVEMVGEGEQGIEFYRGEFSSKKKEDFSLPISLEINASLCPLEIELDPGRVVCLYSVTKVYLMIKLKELISVSQLRECRLFYRL